MSPSGRCPPQNWLEAHPLCRPFLSGSNLSCHSQASGVEPASHLAFPPGPQQRTSQQTQLTWGRSGKNLPALGGPDGAEPRLMGVYGGSVDWSSRVQTPLTCVERLCANISSLDTEGCDRRLPAGHLGPSDKCACTCESATRKMRPEPSRIRPGRRTAGPRPGVRAWPTHSPASPGASSLPSRGKRSLQSPARPFLALLLLASVKQVRAVFIIVVVIIISGAFFLITEAI